MNVYIWAGFEARGGETRTFDLETLKERGYFEDLEVDEKITLALISHKTNWEG
jgi:hypothetical protein